MRSGAEGCHPQECSHFTFTQTSRERSWRRRALASQPRARWSAEVERVADPAEFQRLGTADASWWLVVRAVSMLERERRSSWLAADQLNCKLSSLPPSSRGSDRSRTVWWWQVGRKQTRKAGERVGGVCSMESRVLSDQRWRGVVACRLVMAASRAQCHLDCRQTKRASSSSRVGRRRATGVRTPHHPIHSCFACRVAWIDGTSRKRLPTKGQRREGLSWRKNTR